MARRLIVGLVITMLFPLPLFAESPNDVREGMVLIPAGEFMMGSPSGKGNDDEQPQHKVYVDAFYMDRCEVTNAQYKAFLDATAYNGRQDADEDYLNHWNGGTYPSGQGSHPVLWVSWKNARMYAVWARKRLPTEAEWEKACRAGSAAKYYYGNDEGRLGDYAWHISNSGDKRPKVQEWCCDLLENYTWYILSSGGEIPQIPHGVWDWCCDLSDKTHPVGQKTPNAWGLYDMHGNVWEWCSDWYDENYYKNSPSSNPTGPTNGQYRVIRGGSWSYGPKGLRSASRSYDASVNTVNITGFRCAQDF